MKKVFSGLFSIFLLIVVSVLVFNVQPVRASGTIYIRADGRIDPPIAPISTLDSITYTLIGNTTSDADGIVVERDNIIVNGAGYVVRGTDAYLSKGIDLSGRSNVTISNMSISTFYCGVHLDSSSNNIIDGNTIRDNGLGIWLSSSSNNNWVSRNIIADNIDGVVVDSSDTHISGNTFFNDGLEVANFHGNVVVDNLVNGKPLVYLENVSDYAIEDAGQVILVTCNRITVENLNLSRANYGLQLWQTNNTEISRNNIGDNITEYNFYSVLLLSCSNNSVSGNNIGNDILGIYLDFSSNNTISENNITNSGFAIYLDSSSDNTVSENNMTNDSDGVLIRSSSNNNVSGNNVYHSVHGICLYSSSHNIISTNNMMANTWDAISLRDNSENNTVNGNNMTHNDVGITLYGSSGNRIFHNSFIKNRRQTANAFSINVWDDDYPSGGNYWSDYNGTDANHDGIGDAPYVVDTDNRDNYPLMPPLVPGDINGDTRVNLKDLVLLALAFGSKPGDPKWNRYADIDGNNIVESSDLAILAQHYGQHYP